MGLVQKIECSQCHRPTSATEGLHIEGTIRNGYRGEELSDEGEYFFCSAECLWAFLGLGDPLVDTETQEVAQAPSQGQRVALEDPSLSLPPLSMDELPPIPPPPRSVSIPNLPELAPKKVTVTRKAPPKGAPPKPQAKVSPKTVARPEDPKPQAKVAPRKLFNQEEPVGFSLPKGLPNTGKLPGELAKYSEPPTKDLGEMEKQFEARLRETRPKPSE